MAFLGKVSIRLGNQYLAINSSGLMVMAPLKPGDIAGIFLAYDSWPGYFKLQASNGLWVLFLTSQSPIAWYQVLTGATTGSWGSSFNMSGFNAAGGTVRFCWPGGDMSLAASAPPEDVAFDNQVGLQIPGGNPYCNCAFDVSMGCGYAQTFGMDMITPGIATILAAKKGIGADFTCVGQACVDLSGVNFTGIDFTNARFNGAKLSGTVFDNTTLTGASFAGASLSNTAFTNATLAGADFSHTDLTHGVSFTPQPPFGSAGKLTKFVGATLPLSVIKKDWSYIDLTGATITDLQPGANLAGLIAVSTVAPGLVLDGANLTNATISGANLTGALLSKADLTGATLNNSTILTGAKMAGAILERANLAGAQLGATADLPAADLSTAFMSNAVFTNANLFQASMPYAQLYGSSAKIDNANLQEVNLANANLGSMNLSQAKLMGATLDGAVLVNCSLSGANLSATTSNKSASLVQASLQGADLTQAKLTGAHLSNAAVAVWDGTQIFTMATATYEAALNSGIITQAISTEFANKGYPLAQGASLSVVSENSVWQITYTTDTLAYVTYVIAKDSTTPANLDVSLAVVGVILFRLSTAQFEPTLDSKSLFTLDTATYVAGLNSGTISTALGTAFASAGYPLTKQATLNVVTPSSAWTISDTDAQNNAVQYDIAAQGAQLWVTLDLATAFSNNGYPLSTQAVTVVVTTGSQWQVNDNNISTSSAATGYTIYTVLKDGTDLVVYGSAMAVVRINDQHQLEAVIVSVAPTLLSPGSFDDNTVCPNQATYGQNVKSGRTWTQMMTAPKPPKPAPCIPSPFTWCDSESGAALQAAIEQNRSE